MYGNLIGTVNGYTISKSVPSNAQFTDTKYTAATAAPGNIAASGSAGSSTNYARQDHTHGIALATGDSNGQVKIAGTNVSVKGLGTAAYTASTAYAASSHTHSYAGSSSAGGSATSAVKLDSDAGSTSLPVYFSGGKPAAVTATSAAASGGTTLTLVTTGQKYTWNNKSNLAIGTTASTAAAGNHTHSCSIATDSGTNALTMAASTKYKLTAGGSTYIFTTPPDTKYTAATAAPGNIASSGSAGSSANYARQDHTHGIALATGDSNGQVKIAGSNVSVKGLAAAAYKAVDTKPASGSANLVTSSGVHSRIAYKKFTLNKSAWSGPYEDTYWALTSPVLIYRLALSCSEFTAATNIVSVQLSGDLIAGGSEEESMFSQIYQVETGASLIEFRALGQYAPWQNITVVVGYVIETLDTMSTQATLPSNSRYVLSS